MKGEFLRLIKHSITYGFFYSLMRAIGFILLPLYTRYLPPSRYGILELLTVSISVAIVLFQLGMHSAIIRFYVYFSDEEGKRKVASTAFFYMLIFITIMLLLFFPFSGRIANLIGIGSSYKDYVRIILFITAFQTLYSTPLAIHRARGKPLNYSLILFSGALLRLLLIVIFLVILNLEIKGILLGTMYSALFVLLIGTYTLKNEIKPRLFSSSILKKLLFFGIPLVPTSLSFQVLSISDRYFLQRMRTLNELGIYSVGYKIGLIMEFAVMAFQMAWGPMMYRAEKREDAPLFYSKVMTYFTIFFLLLAAFISLFSHELVRILATFEYMKAATIVPIVSLSYVFYGYYYVTAVGINLKNKTFYFPMIMLIAAILNIVLNFLMIPKMGMMGAALSTLISFMALSLLVAYVSLRYYKIDYELGKIALLFLYWIGILFLNLHFVETFNNFTVKILMKFGLFLFLVYLYILSMEKNERIQLIQHLKNPQKFFGRD